MLKNSQVLAFIARFWMRRPWLLTGTIVLTAGLMILPALTLGPIVEALSGAS